MSQKEQIAQSVSRAEALLKFCSAVPNERDFQFFSGKKELAELALDYIDGCFRNVSAARTMLEVARTTSEANAEPAALEALILAHLAASQARAANALKSIREINPGNLEVKALLDKATLYARHVGDRINDIQEAVKCAGGHEDAQARIEQQLQMSEVTFAFASAAQALAQAARAEQHLGVKKTELLSPRYSIG